MLSDLRQLAENWHNYMNTTPNIRKIAMDLLARREHSYYELRRKLLLRDFSENEIDAVLNQLSKEGLQSDERFSESYIAMRKQRGYGPNRIQQELSERGVSIELIETYLISELDEWRTLAENVRCKKFGLTAPNNFEEKAKQMRFLQYRGFTLDQINHCFN